MKKTTRVGSRWWAVSLSLMLCTVAAVLAGLSGKNLCLVDISALKEPSCQILECFQRGDYQALGTLLYGQPRLEGPGGEDMPADLLWDAYLQSLQFQFPGSFSQNREFMELDALVICLDLNAVVTQMQTRAAAPSHAGDSSLNDIAAQVLADTPPTMQRAIKLQLTQTNGTWQVMLNDPLIQLFSGFVAK